MNDLTNEQKIECIKESILSTVPCVVLNEINDPYKVALLYAEQFFKAGGTVKYPKVSTPTDPRVKQASDLFHKGESLGGIAKTLGCSLDDTKALLMQSNEIIY